MDQFYGQWSRLPMWDAATRVQFPNVELCEWKYFFLHTKNKMNDEKRNYWMKIGICK